jgi:flagellar biosynthesis chaperone FliJ
MKRFEFKQERLLRVRRQLRRQCEMQLVQIQAKLNAATMELNEIDRQLSACVTGAAATRAKPSTDSWQWIGQSQSLLRGREAVQGRIRVLQVERDAKAEELRQRMADTETLEGLRQRQWRVYREQVEAEKQQQLDEVAVGLWRRQQDDPFRLDAHQDDSETESLNDD